MLPYLVFDGHHKYVSCLPHCLNEMDKLQETAPEVHEQFMAGHFGVRRVSGKFNAVWTDMALEQSYNRDAKAVLFHGINQKHATMDKYLKVLPVLTAISEETHKVSHIPDSKSKNTENSANSNCNAVRRIKSVVNDQVCNPFTCMNSVDLLNISTGEKAPSVELIHAREKGIKLLREAEEQNSDKVKTYKIKTFATKHNTAQPRAKQINRLYKDESAVTYSRYFVHNLDDTAKVETLSHEWTPYPPSLFESNKEWTKAIK